MTIEDSPRFCRKLADLVELYGARVSEGRITGYFEALRDLPMRALEEAMAHAAKFSDRFPRPAELRRFARERMPPRHVSELVRLPPGWEPASAEHAGAAFQLVGAICSTRMSARQRLAHVRAMATAFPGVGWEQAAAETAELVRAREGQAA